MPITKEDLDTAKQKDREREEDKAQAKQKEEERKENEAPRKAASDAVKYIKEKLGMKKGGTASSRADGIAQRGKTRGKMV